MSVKYVDKDDVVYTVEKFPNPEPDAPDDNDYYAAVIYDEDGVPLSEIEEVVKSENQAEVEDALLRYAQENGLIPLAVKNIIADPKRIFQGTEVPEAPDFIKLKAEEFQKKAVDYFDMKRQSEKLEVEKTEKVKELKTRYDSQISDLHDAMENLEPIMRTGFEKITCIASWERDPESESMILIRKDTGKPLKIRPMTADELHPEVFDNQNEEPCNEEPESENTEGNQEQGEEKVQGINN
jgi:hypothetical protein